MKMETENKLIKDIETASKIVLKEDEKLFKELAKYPTKQDEFDLEFGNKMYRQGFKQGIQKAIDVLNNIENPYPEDIFLPVSKEEYTTIHILLLKHFNISLDRVSADLMRRARENLTAEQIEKLNQEVENENKK